MTPPSRARRRRRDRLAPPARRAPSGPRSLTPGPAQVRRVCRVWRQRKGIRFYRCLSAAGGARRFVPRRHVAAGRADEHVRQTRDIYPRRGGRRRLGEVGTRGPVNDRKRRFLANKRALRKPWLTARHAHPLGWTRARREGQLCPNASSNERSDSAISGCAGRSASPSGRSGTMPRSRGRPSQRPLASIGHSWAASRRRRGNPASRR